MIDIVGGRVRVVLSSDARAFSAQETRKIGVVFDVYFPESSLLSRVEARLDNFLAEIFIFLIFFFFF